jgi:hypothetical protein
VIPDRESLLQLAAELVADFPQYREQTLLAFVDASVDGGWDPTELVFSERPRIGGRNLLTHFAARGICAQGSVKDPEAYVRVANEDGAALVVGFSEQRADSLMASVTMPPPRSRDEETAWLTRRQQSTSEGF